MTIKLNSYIIQDDVIEKMRAKIEETKQKNIELGFGLCRMKFVNTLKPGAECSGDVCSIHQPAECQTGLFVGGYHTHPSGSAEPSITDLIAAYANDVGCIGSTNNDIKCFVRTSYRKPEEEKQIISTWEEVEKGQPKTLPIDEYEKWKSARDNILNKFFQSVNVQSSNIQSPNIQSPNIQSPNIQSPNIQSPNIE